MRATSAKSNPMTANNEEPENGKRISQNGAVADTRRYNERRSEIRCDTHTSIAKYRPLSERIDKLSVGNIAPPVTTTVSSGTNGKAADRGRDNAGRLSAKALISGILEVTIGVAVAATICTALPEPERTIGGGIDARRDPFTRSSPSNRAKDSRTSPAPRAETGGTGGLPRIRSGSLPRMCLMRSSADRTAVISFCRAVTKTQQTHKTDTKMFKQRIILEPDKSAAPRDARDSNRAEMHCLRQSRMESCSRATHKRKSSPALMQALGHSIF